MCDPAACIHGCPRHGGVRIPECVCDDDSVKLAALVADGIPQRIASLMLWAPEELDNT